MILIPVTALAAFALLAYAAIRELPRTIEAQSTCAGPASAFAAERLARGEISKAEYEQIVRLL